MRREEVEEELASQSQGQIETAEFSSSLWPSWGSFRAFDTEENFSHASRTTLHMLCTALGVWKINFSKVLSSTSPSKEERKNRPQTPSSSCKLLHVSYGCKTEKGKFSDARRKFHLSLNFCLRMTMASAPCAESKQRVG
jgi:hypothetical protein